MVKEPKDSKDLTHCCGGPVESIFPKTANQIGEKRVQQLKDTKAKSAVLMCPICLATLKKVAGVEIEVSDISSLLAKVYCDGQFS
jgi:Fe-S oxidoreductase